MRAASMAAMIVLAVVFLPKFIAADSFLYRDVLSAPVAIGIASGLKLAFLALGAAFATRCYRSFEPRNPVRNAWLLLALGLALYVIAQSILVYYQLISNLPTPFPSAADLFFVPATMLMAVSFFHFVLVYRRAGLPIAGGREVSALLGASVILVMLFVHTVAHPILASDAPAAERWLNVAYPLLDCLLLVPALLLLRMAWEMRGGSLWRVWMTLVIGVLCMVVGDILFAFFTTFGQTSLDPLLDLMFAWSYVLIALALSEQLGILSEESW